MNNSSPNVRRAAAPASPRYQRWIERHLGQMRLPGIILPPKIKQPRKGREPSKEPADA
jgi:hypothetical protein